VKVQFFDRQDEGNPISGVTVPDPGELRFLLDRMRNRPPFFAELVGENGFKLLIGIGASEGCAQYSATDGSPPYMMARATTPCPVEGEAEFLIGGTASPVPRRYCLPWETLVQVASHFVTFGERFPGVAWEEV
jgi:hypothetical protein